MLRRRPDPVVTRGGAAVFGVIIAIGAIALAIPLLPGESAPHEGDIAPRAFAAVRESEYVSEELTAAARDEAEAAVEPVMGSLEEVPDEQLALLATLFEEVSRLRLRSGLSSDERLQALGESPGGIGLGQAIRSTLLTLSVRNLEDAAAVGGGGGERHPELAAAAGGQAQPHRGRTCWSGTCPRSRTGRAPCASCSMRSSRRRWRSTRRRRRTLREEAREAVAPVVVTYSQRAS